MKDSWFRFCSALLITFAAAWPLILFGLAGCKKPAPEILTGIPAGSVCSPMGGNGAMYCIAGGVVYVCVRTADDTAACGMSAATACPEAPAR